MRKAVLLATVMAFACADFALAAPAPLASAGKTVASKAGADLTLVRKRKRRMARRRATGTTVAPGATMAPTGRGAAPSRMNSANPSAAPSGQNPAVDQGMRTPKGQ